MIFGDGTTGARLPTGQENVKATYRKGIGLSAVGQRRSAHAVDDAAARRARASPTRCAASGAADPRAVDDARRNAPLTVLTLGRVVSLQGLRRVRRAFSGIDKALATWTWFGEKRGVLRHRRRLARRGGARRAASSTRISLDGAAASRRSETVPVLVESRTRRASFSSRRR